MIETQPSLIIAKFQFDPSSKNIEIPLYFYRAIGYGPFEDKKNS